MLGIWQRVRVQAKRQWMVLLGHRQVALEVRIGTLSNPEIDAEHRWQIPQAL
jgi:hypothetical protein